MVIQHNVLAANAQRQYNIIGKRKAAHTEKLSSGYRINRASDDAAGLAISEKMRRQIRGLTRGTANAEDGISYVQTADGAMSEVHEILQRMNELTVQSLNGTLSESDRSYLDDEFNQLRTEIDRINKTTDFNDQRIFEDHENAYWSITGNKQWNLSQAHRILPAPSNEMNIHLPAGYDPKDYTFSVPAGTYTTRELMDEIDTALENLKPSNPGFVFERTKEGYCKLTFEGGSGINSVDGPLSYLFFDSAQGSSSSSILGTTVFNASFPLKIESGKNDTLGFFVEKYGKMEEISIEIPAGSYSRPDMIKLLNKKLAENPASAGVVAKEYGESSIQITGGNMINITGLNGNMFKLENTRPYYSSVFYDNVQYGGSTATGATPAKITGATYYNFTYADKIRLIDGKNNVLRIQLNDAADYKDIKLSEGEYTVSELAAELKKQLEANGLKDAATASGSISCLTLTSSIDGEKSIMKFDTPAKTVYEATYNALFRDTRYVPISNPGENVLRPKLTGAADLSGTIALPDNASLDLTFEGNKYTISGISKNPASLSALVQELNDKINTDSSLADLRGKVQFELSGANLAFGAQIDGGTIGSFTQNETYKKLFTGSYTPTSYPDFPAIVPGKITEQQGSTELTITNAKAYAKLDEPDRKITINDKYNILGFYVNGAYKYIDLTVGSTYNGIGELVTELNKKFASSGDTALNGIKASFENGSLTITAAPPSNYSTNTNYTLSFDSGCSAWGSINGTEQPVSVDASQTKSRPSTLTTYTSLPDSITIDGSNDELTLTLGNNTSAGGTQVTATLSLKHDTYSRDEIRDLLKDAIAASTDLNGKVTADLSGSQLKFTSDSNHPIKAEGSFYKDVLITSSSTSESLQKTGTDSTVSFSPAYIIGRKDLRNSEPIEIVQGANDKLIFDFACDPTSAADKDKAYKETFEITIPEGKYDGSQITDFLTQAINDEFAKAGITDFDVDVSIGGVQTSVIGNIDSDALQIKVSKKTDGKPVEGEYVLDGIRGSAAGFLFYKTDGIPTPTYITGSKRLPGTIKFDPSNNVLTMNIDDKPYKYTFPTDRQYTANEFINLFNDMFKNGDDNGSIAPISATLENGYLKLSHKVVGNHTITDIGGSARSYLFLDEEGRSSNSQDPLRLQVSGEAKDKMDIPRMRVGSTALGIHSIFISEPKYAEKALQRISDAIIMMGAKRGTYGAIQNRLEHLVANNNNVIENTTAAESRIRDADMAKEMVGFSISNILAQAGASMLAQANQSNQGVMTLLG